jgi:glyoxylate utilization-related uncharacterized protein
MLYNENNAPRRIIDSSLEILDLFTSPQQPFDMVVGILNGFHGKFINKLSDKYYYILNGTARVEINNEVFQVHSGDFVRVPANSKHSIDGRLKMLIICSPPYTPSSEEHCSE